MTKLEIVIDRYIKYCDCVDRRDALIKIDESIDIVGGQWVFAELNCVLDENESAEEFAIEFMTAYNKEVSNKY